LFALKYGFFKSFCLFLPSLRKPKKPNYRDDRPAPLKQQEPPLMFDNRICGEQSGADGVHQQISYGLLVEDSPLGESEACEDGKRTDDLDPHAHGKTSCERRQAGYGASRPEAERFQYAISIPFGECPVEIFISTICGTLFVVPRHTFCSTVANFATIGHENDTIYLFRRVFKRTRQHKENEGNKMIFGQESETLEFKKTTAETKDAVVVPYFAYGKAYIRVADECKQISPEDNPGTFPEGFDPGGLYQRLRVLCSRNPLLAEIMYYSKDIERFGTGLQKIARECEGAGVRYGFKCGKLGFTVIFYRMEISGLGRDFDDGQVSGTSGTSDAVPDVRSIVSGNIDSNLHGDLRGVIMQVTAQDKRIASLLNFCAVPRTREQMQQHIGILNREHFRKSILRPLLESGKLTMTIPDKPHSRNQKYVKTGQE
jgi:hypothetical protein